MCLSIPGKVISIDETNPELRMGKVSFSGVTKEICLQWVPDVQVGEYVLAHVGFALSKIDEKDAHETLAILKEMGDLEEPNEIS